MKVEEGKENQKLSLKLQVCRICPELNLILKMLPKGLKGLDSMEFNFIVVMGTYWIHS